MSNAVNYVKVLNLCPLDISCDECDKYIVDAIKIESYNRFKKDCGGIFGYEKT